MTPRESRGALPLFSTWPRADVVVSVKNYRRVNNYRRVARALGGERSGFWRVHVHIHIHRGDASNEPSDDVSQEPDLPFRGDGITHDRRDLLKIRAEWEEYGALLRRRAERHGWLP